VKYPLQPLGASGTQTELPVPQGIPDADEELGEELGKEELGQEELGEVLIPPAPPLAAVWSKSKSSAQPATHPTSKKSKERDFTGSSLPRERWNEQRGVWADAHARMVPAETFP